MLCILICELGLWDDSAKKFGSLLIQFMCKMAEAAKPVSEDHHDNTSASGQMALKDTVDILDYIANTIVIVVTIILHFTVSLYFDRIICNDKYTDGSCQ